MADKKAPASGCPIVSGEYVVGNPEIYAEIMDLIDIEDSDNIESIVNECILKTPGAEDGEQAEADEEESSGIRGIPTLAKPDMECTKKLTDALDYKVALLTRDMGLGSGIQSSSLEGAVYGSILALVLIGIPVVLKLLL